MMSTLLYGKLSMMMDRRANQRFNPTSTPPLRSGVVAG
jgi:hypothetical protein